MHIKELFRNRKNKKTTHLDFQFILPSNNRVKVYKQKNIEKTNYVFYNFQDIKVDNLQLFPSTMCH